MTDRFLDILVFILLIAAGIVFFLGSRALSQREDLQALYWMITGIVLLRSVSQLARADRAHG